MVYFIAKSATNLDYVTNSQLTHFDKVATEAVINLLSYLYEQAPTTRQSLFVQIRLICTKS